MCLRRAPEKYIAGAELDRAGLDHQAEDLLLALIFVDHLCGLVARVPGYRSRGPGFDSRH
jgi:hypothetical protein